jgi:heme-binding protein
VSASPLPYLQSHPETNQALTDIAKQTPTQASESYRVYFANNPQVAQDLKAIQQPSTELASQCNTQVTPNLVVDALTST